MIKHFEEILCIILVITLFFSIPITAFAVENSDIIYTDYEGNTETYKYADTLKEGNNSVEILKSGKYKVFTPDRSGVYSFGCDAVFFIPESVSGSVASGYIKTPYAYEKYYYNFEANKPQYIFFYGIDESNVCTEDCIIEYLGKPKELICNNDGISLINQEIFYDEESDTYYINQDFEMTFTESNEKASFCFAETKTPIKSGVNTVEIDMLGKSFAIKLNVRSIEEYIKGFALPNNYTNTGYLLYNGNVIEKYPKYVTVFYTDGSSEKLSVRNDGLIEIDIPNLRIFDTAIVYDEGHMIINIAGKSYDLGAEAKKSGIFLNTIELISNIQQSIFESFASVAVLSSLGDYDTASDKIRLMRESIADEISMYRTAI